MDDNTIHGWISLARYCEISGETRTAVHTRVAGGHWQRGVHYSAPDGGAAWVNTNAVRDWLEGGASEPKVVPVTGTPDKPLDLYRFGERPAPVLTTTAMTLAEAVQEEAPKTFISYIPQLLGDEADEPVYANLTGMDMPESGMTGSVLGKLTKKPRSARQFLTAEECEAWCAGQIEDIFFCCPVELPYV